MKDKEIKKHVVDILAEYNFKIQLEDMDTKENIEDLKLKGLALIELCTKAGIDLSNKM